MSETTLSSATDFVTGSCFCGAVQFRVDMPTLFNAHCHCTMCQRVHGAGYVTWIGVPETQLRVTAGADQLRHFASSEHGQRSFCTVCSSSLFCRSTRHPTRVDITVANLHGPVDRAPQVHAYFNNRSSWTDVSDRLPTMNESEGAG